MTVQVIYVIDDDQNDVVVRDPTSEHQPAMWFSCSSRSDAKALAHYIHELAGVQLLPMKKALAADLED